MRLVLFVIGSLVLACSSTEGGDSGGAGSGGKAGGGAPGGGTAGSTGGGSSGSGGTAGGSAGTVGSSGSGGDVGTSGSGGSAGTGGSSGGSTGAWACPAGPFDADPVPDANTAEPIAGVPPADNYEENGFHIIEGPVWFEGALYVSQITGIGSPPKSRIIKSLDGAVTVPLGDIGTNGLAIDNTGALLGARHLDGSISKLDPANAANAMAVISMHDGARFNCPNDIVVRSDGNLYFSDPNYQAPDPTPQDATRVYRVAPGATTADVVDESLDNPNGMLLTLDENTLYVTHPNGMVQYPLNADGSVGGGSPVNGMPGGDGMGMDCAGNIYMTGGNAVVVYSPDMTEIDSIDLPENSTNVAFGGPERKTLFITTLGNTARAYSIELNVPGKPY